nr:TetR family transcriptional regulator [Alphaproteobacteria bacterium]
GLPCFLRSMAWMLEAAGLPSGGISGAARAAGLGALYANAVRVWLRDDTPDMAKTMAALDRGLGCADGIVSFFCRRDVKEEA